jgi:hypothetical protein
MRDSQKICTLLRKLQEILVLLPLNAKAHTVFRFSAARKQAKIRHCEDQLLGMAWLLAA